MTGSAENPVLGWETFAVAGGESSAFGSNLSGSAVANKSCSGFFWIINDKKADNHTCCYRLRRRQVSRSAGHGRLPAGDPTLFPVVLYPSALECCFSFWIHMFFCVDFKRGSAYDRERRSPRGGDRRGVWYGGYVFRFALFFFPCCCRLDIFEDVRYLEAMVRKGYRQEYLRRCRNRGR